VSGSCLKVSLYVTLIYLRQVRPTRVLGEKAHIEAHAVPEAYEGLGCDAAVAVDTIAGLLLALSPENPFNRLGFEARPLLDYFVKITKKSSLPRGGMVGNLSHQMNGSDFTHRARR